ncbi:MAG: TauD/TfdA family dioxygenase [Sphingomonadales bacterium]|nr:MAG: TauD/TfdA family dioxygenase [Sphingomonadales bacterium]
MLETRKLDERLPFGAAVHGLTIDMVGDPAVRAALRDLWIRESVLVFRDCPATAEFHVALGKSFGELLVHRAAHIHVEGNPELVQFTADPEQEGIYRVDGVDKVGWIPWHADLAWMPESNRGGLLRALTVPKEGGETGFMSRFDIYDRMPEELRQAVEGREVVTRIRNAYETNPYVTGQDAELRYKPKHIEESELRLMASNPPCVHPLIAAQPETGRKFLNFSPAGADYILGMDAGESHDLLSQVARYANDDSKAYRHSWKLGEYILWDNWVINHKAYGCRLGEERVMQRVTLASDGQQVVGRLLEMA